MCFIRFYIVKWGTGSSTVSKKNSKQETDHTAVLHTTKALTKRTNCQRWHKYLAYKYKYEYKHKYLVSSTSTST